MPQEVSLQGVQHRQGFVVFFSNILEYHFVSFVVAICDLVHNVDTVHCLWYVNW